MTAPAGWYPDPGGRPGHFRFWDGRGWSPNTTTNPAAPAPGVPAAPTPGFAATALPPKRSPVGLIVGAVVLLVVIALVVVGVRILTRTDSIDGPGPVVVPTASSSEDPATCPRPPSASPSPGSTAGNRVVSGKISYPALAAPYGAPHSDSRVPFGRDVQTQDKLTERSSDGKTPWAASVLIATLTAGDGFYGPEQGAKLVARCITATFYGDNEVTRHDTVDKATTIDGHPAWLVESHLTYDITGLKAKGELLVVAVIDTGDGNAGLFYASVPDNAPTLVPPARAAYKGLRVS